MESKALHTVVILTLLENLLFGSWYFGWGSIVYIATNEGFFLDKCLNASILNTTDEVNFLETCAPREEQFNLIFTINNAILPVISVSCGYIMYKIGSKKTRLIAIGSFVAGAACLGFSSAEHPMLLLAGIVFSGGGGLVLLTSSMTIAEHLASKSLLFIALVNGCYDASSATMLILKISYDQGIAYWYSLVGLTVLFIIVSGLVTILHPNYEQERKTTSGSNEITDENRELNDVHDQFLSSEEKPVRVRVGFHLKDFFWNRVWKNPITNVIHSWIFQLHLLWACVNLLYLCYYVGTVNYRIKKTVVSLQEESYYIDLLGYIMFGGLLPSFGVGYISEWLKQRVKNRYTQMSVLLTLTSCSSVTLAAIISFQGKSVFYPSFILITFIRAFLFSVNMDFIFTMFPKMYKDVLFGIVIMMTGIFSLAQYGLFHLALKYNALFEVDLALLCLCVASLAHPLYVFFKRNSSSEKLPRNFNTDD